MITSFEKQWRRCPTCDGPLQENCECPRCAENGIDRSKQTDAHTQSIAETLTSLHLSEEELAAVKARLILEIERRAPQFLKSVTIAVALPVLEQRAERFYAANRVPPSEVEELGSTFVLKTLRQLFGQELHGQAGAWISTIRNSVLWDHRRAKAREQKRFGNRKGAGAIEGIESLDDESMTLYVDDLRGPSREIAQRSLHDAEWTAISVHYQRKLDDARQAVESLQWDEGSLPLYKNRHRHRPDA